VRSPRALSFVFTSAIALTLAACGGLLGFGDDDDDSPPSSPDAPDAADATTEPAPNPDSGGGPDPSTDAAASIDAIATTDAPIDVSIDQKTNDGSVTDILVLARFEDAVTGPDGADVASNMVVSKTGHINGAQSAQSQATHPAYVGWAFLSQDHVYVSFSMHVTTMPTGAGAEILQLRGTGGTVGLTIGGPSSAVFGVRSDTASATGVKVSAATTYRVGLEIDRVAKVARAGIIQGTKPPLGLQIAWPSPGTVDTLVIGALTNQTAFAITIDDVLVSTKGVQ